MSNLYNSIESRIREKQREYSILFKKGVKEKCSYSIEYYSQRLDALNEVLVIMQEEKAKIEGDFKLVK